MLTLGAKGSIERGSLGQQQGENREKLAVASAAAAAAPGRHDLETPTGLGLVQCAEKRATSLDLTAARNSSSDSGRACSSVHIQTRAKMATEPRCETTGCAHTHL